jgi:hypothetical protein
VKPASGFVGDCIDAERLKLHSVTFLVAQGEARRLVYEVLKSAGLSVKKILFISNVKMIYARGAHNSFA